ncbi:hypothetical protein [Pedobacter mendelii]|uniref:DUF3575 domain-containing protein n=1 Tax=Pedobacter mendelii TaxID=1908240 RepID=A0ABQ2BDU7_9SPHI|nr:hypothetical protein [Pedobacter mendelii]GGI23840.1 hypothetical protein GCM10008119_09670 [Pedobacter mendelii]
MKKLITFMLLFLISFGGLVQAQTKKTTKAKTPAKKTTSTTATKKVEIQPKAEQPLLKTPVSTKKNFAAGTQGYKTAIGLKILYGIGITGKHFFTSNHAFEAIVKYRNFTGVASDISLTALYEYHGLFNQLEGLRWYGGGGAFVGNFAFKEEFNWGDQQSNIYYAVCGVLGLEYKLKNIPIAISADWQPGYMIKDTYNDSGFGADNGGFGIKYTF